MATSAQAVEADLQDLIGDYYTDPLGYVRDTFPWRTSGTILAGFSEPDYWQCEFLEWLGGEITARGFDGINPVLPIRGAVSSGHGIGKGALAGMLTSFLMSTRPDCKGVVTANTSTQLSDKTWAAITVWIKMSLTAHWFELNTSIMYRKGHRESWKCSPQTCAPDNSEAFAGQHNTTSTSFYLNDEDSNVPDIIHDVQEGGLTDGESMQFLFGNPTRRRGKFYDIVFARKESPQWTGVGSSGWKTWVIDARTCRHPNQAFIAEQKATYGEDSDFFRVRVRGLPPHAEDAQFIDSLRVSAAQRRAVVVLPDEPLVAGCDLAWGGSDANVIRFRRGRDGRSIPALRIPGELTRDPSVLTNRLADVLSSRHGPDQQLVSMLFLDSAGIAGSIGQRLRQLGFQNVREINFGADSPDGGPGSKYRYFRDFMWGQLKEWLLVGAIDSSPQLEADLTGPGLREDLQQRVWLESKKEMKARGVPSPDEADALALTFAQNVAIPGVTGAGRTHWAPVSQSWQG